MMSSLILISPSVFEHSISEKVLRVISVCMFVILPAFGRFAFKEDSVFVMYELVMLDLSLISMFIVYCKLTLLSLHISANGSLV